MKGMNMENVRVWNRKYGEIREESIYRGGTLQFLFRNGLGRLLMRYVLPYRRINDLVTWRQRSPRSRREIVPFIERFGIDTSEFIRPVDAFTSFADFFVRELRPGARPIAAGADALVSPCDGRIEWLVSRLAADTAFEVKGQRYTLPGIFCGEDLAQRFIGGSILGIYLAPFDYHRFCFPCDGRVIFQRRVGTRYFSVNEQSLAAGFRVLDCNIRNYTVLNRNSITWAMVEVAGFYAGRIVDLDREEALKAKGAMKGYFDIGGSFILLVFPSGSLQVDRDISEQLDRGLPVRVQLGERIGTVVEEGYPE